MKIGLVTCYFIHNYGSSLQAYATEMLMKKLNKPYETIGCVRPINYMQENKILYTIKKILIGDWKLKIGRLKIRYYKKINKEFEKECQIRDQYFEKFIQKYFHLSPISKNRNELEQRVSNYDCIIVGSDQLWRTDSVEHGYYTLEWVPDNIKKIAYATSFGITRIPWFQKAKNKRFMNRFSHIALREQSGCNLVYQLTGRKTNVVLDPTLLFTGEDWMHIQEKDPIEKEPYIFCYFLGNNPEQRNFVKKVKAKTGLQIVSLLHLDDYIPSDENFPDKAPYNVGPGEFLNYIRNAQYVFTDSFHCSVFSILYKKSFFTFKRFNEKAKQNTNTRIDNLLKITSLSYRGISTNSSIEKILSIPNEFTTTEERLKILRDSSINYLINSLKE